MGSCEQLKTYIALHRKHWICVAQENERGCVRCEFELGTILPRVPYLGVLNEKSRGLKMVGWY